MKTTLFLVFGLFAVAYARSTVEEGLLSELKDLLKRQEEEEQRPPHRGPDVSDEVRACVNENFDQCASSNGVQLPTRPEAEKRRRGGGRNICIVKDEAKRQAMHACIQAACNVEEDELPMPDCEREGGRRPPHRGPEISEEVRACVEENFEDCASDHGIDLPARPASSSEEDKRRPHGRGGPNICIITDSAQRQTVHDCIKGKCNVEDDDLPMPDCSKFAKMQCVRANLTACAALEGVTLTRPDRDGDDGPPEKRRRGRPNPFCHIVEDAGKEKALEIHKCLNTACQLGDKPMPRCKPLKCIRANTTVCATKFGVTLPERPQERAEGKPRRGPRGNPFCQWVRYGNREKALEIRSCLEEACDMEPKEDEPDCTDFLCIVDNRETCMTEAGVTPEQAKRSEEKRRPGKPRGGHYCRFAHEHGEEAAKTFSSCLETACNLPQREQEDCPEPPPAQAEARTLATRLLQLLNLE